MLGVVGGEALQQRADAPFEIADANGCAVQVFMACQTQWRVGMAGATGLDYQALESVMRLQQVEDPVDCFWRVQVIEFAVLGHWGEQSQAARVSQGKRG